MLDIDTAYLLYFLHDVSYMRFMTFLWHVTWYLALTPIQIVN
jgi:hypothetical protein